jgi:hypothetical protein
MDDRLTQRILADARRSLEPTEADRDRVLEKVMASVAVASAAGLAATASQGSGAGGLFAALGKGAIVKIVVATVMLGGIAAVAVRSFDDWQKGAGELKAPHFQHLRSGAATTIARSAETDAIEATKGIDVSVSSDRPPKSIAVDMHAGSWSLHHPSKNIVETVDSAPDDGPVFLEIAAVKDASSALRSGNPFKTLRILDEYEATYGKAGVMKEEREGLRVPAMCAIDEKGAARAAFLFLRDYPNSPMAVRIQEECEGELKELKASDR